MARRKALAAGTVPARAPPLDAAAWIAAALDALAADGIEAVRVEPIAKALHVTKGSFYWHFADRRALIDAMLAQWSDGRISAIREQAPHDGDPAFSLRRLAELYTRRSNARGLSIELAIRALARNDGAAAAAVQAVDSERLQHVATLFERMGWPPHDARARSILFYGFLFGQSLLDRRSAIAADTEAAVSALLKRPD